MGSGLMFSLGLVPRQRTPPPLVAFSLRLDLANLAAAARVVAAIGVAIVASAQFGKQQLDI